MWALSPCVSWSRSFIILSSSQVSFLISCLFIQPYVFLNEPLTVFFRFQTMPFSYKTVGNGKSVMRQPDSRPREHWRERRGTQHYSSSSSRRTDPQKTKQKTKADREDFPVASATHWTFDPADAMKTPNRLATRLSLLADALPHTEYQLLFGGIQTTHAWNLIRRQRANRLFPPIFPLLLPSLRCASPTNLALQRFCRQFFHFWEGSARYLLACAPSPLSRAPSFISRQRNARSIYQNHKKSGGS